MHLCPILLLVLIMELRWKIQLSTVLLLIIIIIGSFAFIGIVPPTSTPSLEETSIPSQEFAPMQVVPQSQTTKANASKTEEALMLAKETFVLNCTETILQCRVFRHYEDTDIYYVSIYYARIFNYSEGEFQIPYRHDYNVNTQTRTVNEGITIDVPEGFVAKFIGQIAVRSIKQAIQTYYMLLDKSPSENYWIYSIENDQLSLEAIKTKDMYHVAGTFKNFAVNCLNAKITIVYDIFQNGTAIIESVRI
jgi:hypothetical protein